MSGLAITAAVVVGLYLGSNRKPVQKHKQRETRTILPDHYGTTSNYGEVKDVSNVINRPGFIVSETRDFDLQGVPVRWLRARTGAVYRTYDMETQFV